MDAPDKNFSLLAGQTAHPTTESAVASAAAPELIGLVTHEDVDRARDRWEVARARSKGRTKSFGGFRLLWLLVGPGVLVFLGENDAPSMLSYSADGSRYGVGFFIPFVVLTFIMGFIVQEMTVRLGAVTHRGHAELIFDRFGKFWGFFSMGDLIFGNFLTLVTEFIGVRAGLGFFGVRPAIAVGGALVIVVAAITTGRYWTWERITLSLAIFNGLFIPAAILARPDWH
jgi:Mn2+/Fe2+ NRAMP family transporter